MKYRGVIFDMDGVLVDTERVYQDIWQELARERGVVLEDSFARTICGTSGELMCRVLEKYYHTEESDLLIEECLNRMAQRLAVHVPIKEGVREILAYFKEKGLHMAVASSSVKERIRDNVSKTGIQDYFEELVSGSEVEHGKPAPDIFELAAARIGCKPEECFVFEDSENGVRAGHAAGCAVMMIPDILEPSEEIKPYCTEIYDSFIQVREEIEKYL